jgi:serine hydrolase
VVIASNTDPYVDLDRARFFARCWGARLVEAGDQGNINVESGHGEWAAGEQYLAELLEEA